VPTEQTPVVMVVGAGLAAAVYAASEGLATIALDAVAPGGDVRSGSVKRIGSAVGEGSMAIHLITSTWPIPGSGVCKQPCGTSLTLRRRGCHPAHSARSRASIRGRASGRSVRRTRGRRCS
jgi:hypothetical protein